MKIAQLRLVVAVVQRGHRLAVLHPSETLAAIVADAAGRGRVAQRGGLGGPGGLEVGELALQAVVGEIGDLGPRFAVIAFVVGRDFGAEGGDAGGGFGGGHAVGDVTEGAVSSFATAEGRRRPTRGRRNGISSRRRYHDHQA